ncbi:uncharacterized protein B0H64DRAFT_420431 [Chaetomium fimeti]|uniref:Zn(2)-C6 fungal-type domain-containing protein n=1 Tax=Chaetomium fimeti TaxID=1854472 RepID=A0AAE0LMQ1_9PEZI|nr:hypothetical protein B0H64DRAFT_420431 [Chaetomium fimeti]
MDKSQVAYSPDRPGSDSPTSTTPLLELESRSGDAEMTRRVNRKLDWALLPLLSLLYLFNGLDRGNIGNAQTQGDTPGTAVRTGFYPTAVMYLASFYSPFDLAVRIGLFFGQYAIASAFSGALWPDTAWFLTRKERAFATHRMRLEHPGQGELGTLTRRDVVETAKDWKLWFALAFNICVSVPASAFSVFLPLVVQGMGYRAIEANLMSVPPAVCGAIGLYLFASSSDRHRERGYHIAAAIVITLAGLVGVAVRPQWWWQPRLHCWAVGAPESSRVAWLKLICRDDIVKSVDPFDNPLPQRTRCQNMPRPPNPSANLDLSSTSAASPLHRLPVNPRRKKVAPDERKRVATACNSCNVRRIKCSGERPCRQCTSAQRDCLYPEPVERVTIPRAELESLRRRCASLERQMAATERGDRRREAPHQVGSPSVSSRTDTADSLSLDGDTQHTIRPGGIDGRMLADPAGTTRYLGETSGATFLDTLKELITTATPLAQVLDGDPGETLAGTAFLGSVGQYQTHDSRPMVLPTNIDPLALPPEDDMIVALRQARYFIQDGDGAFPSGGIMFWPFEDIQSIVALASLPGMQGPGGLTRPGPHHRALALYHTAFAMARLLNLRDPGSAVDGQLGEDSFARARSLQGNLLDRTTYTISDIAVLALMALYLIENNRRDAAYMAISNAMAISVMHGLHKGGSGNEVGVRTFWTVYVLDRWLGCVMGRPPTTPDDAITLPLPRECPSYREAGLPDLLTNATVRVGKALEMLRKWRESLPASLRLPSDPLTLIPVDLFTQAASFGQGPASLLTGAASFGQDRACWALHMSYNQLVILAVRPAMLMAVWKAVASIVCIHQPFDIEIMHSQIEPIRACSDAARRNLRLGRLMCLHSPRQKLLLGDLHNIFNAAIVLTMHQMVFVNLRTQDLDDVGWASEVFETEAKTGNEYAKDCARVLQDLKYLAQQLRNPIHDPDTKHVLMSGEGALRDLLADDVAGADMMDEGTENAAAPNGDRDSPRNQANRGGLYQGVADIYQTLSCWWHADYMQFYNTFLS